MLSGRHVVVLGGTGAVGSSVVAYAMEAGAKVFASYGASTPAPSKTDRVRWAPLDATRESSVREFFAAASEAWGRVEVVVNTVGTYSGGEPVASLSTEVWDRLMAINTRSAFLALRESLRSMSGQSYGRYIQLAALTALEPSQRSAAYAVSKAAMIHLAEIAARESAGSGITINSIAPRIIDTPDNRRWMPDADRSSWVPTSEICRVINELCDPASTRSGATIRLPGNGIVA